MPVQYKKLKINVYNCYGIFLLNAIFFNLNKGIPT